MQVCFYRFLGPLDTKNGEKLRKKQKKNIFFRHSWSLQGVKNLIKKLIFGAQWVSGGALGYANLFLNVFCAFQAIRGVKNDLDQNMAFLH